MKHKRTLKTIFEEIVANGIGWVAGLLSIDLLDLFFVKKSIWNLGGIFSKKVAVSKGEFSLLEWLLTAIIGFIVMLIVNKFVRKKLFKKLPTLIKKPNKQVIEDQEIKNPETIENTVISEEQDVNLSENTIENKDENPEDEEDSEAKLD